MSALRGLKEFIAPGSVRRASLPPFEAGLSPDSALDAADILLAVDQEVDDVVALANGEVVCSAGRCVGRLDRDSITTIAELDGDVTALAVRNGGVIAAVDGTGVVEIGERLSPVSTDPSVATGVSALAVHDDGTIYATVASRQRGVADWAAGLIAADASGEVIAIAVDGSTRRVLGGVRWPAGVCVARDDRLVVAESLASALFTVARDGSDRSTLASNLPFYPGRVRASALRGGDAGYWLAGPYVRNRATELILSEPEMTADMAKTIDPSEWMVPRLRSDRPHTDALQIGQLRVLGVLKPWAPARSYGLVAHLDQDGRFDWSAHSRPDGTNHGVTGVADVGGRLVLAARGRRNLIAIARPELAVAEQ